MNEVIIPLILKNNPLKLSQGVFCIRKPCEIYHNIDFSENVSSGIRCILLKQSNFCLPYIYIYIYIYIFL